MDAGERVPDPVWKGYPLNPGTPKAYQVQERRMFWEPYWPPRTKEDAVAMYDDWMRKVKEGAERALALSSEYDSSDGAERLRKKNDNAKRGRTIQEKYELTEERVQRVLEKSDLTNNQQRLLLHRMWKRIKLRPSLK